MSITVKDCLNLPSLSLGKVIAGHKGLDSIVTTVSVLEFDDTDEPDIISPNELLISSLFCAKDDVDAQCRLIDKAKKSGDVGLVLFYSDAILGKISPKLLKLADLLQFPIILMPETDMGLKYSDVIGDVTEAIYMNRKANNYFVSDTIQRLSQSSEKDRSPSFVLNLASSYAKAAFFLCDDKENLIASSFWPAANYLDFDRIRSLYEQCDSSSMRIYRVEFQDKKDAHLLLYAVTQNPRLNPAIINEVVEVIQLFSLLWNYNLNLRTPESLIPPLLEGERDLVNYVCRHNHLQISNYTELLILESSDEKILPLTKLHQLFSDASSSAIIDRFGNYTVVLYHNDGSVKSSIIESELAAFIGKQGHNILTAALHSNQLLQEASGFYQTFCAVTGALKKIYPKKTTFTHSDILFANRVLGIITSVDIDSRYYTELLTPIAEDDESELLPTLLTYLLDAEAEVKTTAELLFVHRNTVLYRLNKVRSLLNFDFNKMPQSYDIYLAAAIKRMQTELSI